jgi:exonuclease III
VLSWNVRGLECSRSSVVKDALAFANPSVICLHEYKLRDVPPLPKHVGTYHAVDCDSRGGMITAWDGNSFTLASFITRHQSLTTVLSSTTSDLQLSVTNVYGPSDHRDSPVFLDGLRELAPVAHRQ